MNVTEQFSANLVRLLVKIDTLLKLAGAIVGDATDGDHGGADNGKIPLKQGENLA